MIEKRINAILITVFMLILLSFGSVLTKMTYSSVSPAAFIYLSMLIGMVSMTIYTFLIKKERVPKELMTRKVWSLILQIAFFNFVTGTLGAVALNYMPASTNSYLSNFIGFITMGMSAIILKEFPGLWQILGAVIAFSGLRVFFPNPPQGEQLMGTGLILISILGVAYTNNIARKLALETKNQISNNIISTLAILIGGSVAVVIYILIDGFPPVVPTTQDWLVIFYNGIITRAIFLTLWNLVLRTLRSYEASILGASTVIFTSILAVIILGEVLEIHQIIGILLLLIGLLLVQLRGASVKTIFSGLSEKVHNRFRRPERKD
ncbi:DMT family transporter [bacterium]|nr:MAG: DMT family transporter [bacterium]